MILRTTTGTGLSEDQRGAAYVEFLMSFIPLFIMFLGMVQMALMYAGDLVVQHAASTAVRAAVVVIDDDPAYYDDNPPRRRFEDTGGGSSESALSSVVGLFGGSGGGGGGGGSAPGGPRMDAIRMAASMPLMAISPSLGQLTNSDSIATAIGDPESRGATGALSYNNSAMGVTFPRTPGGDDYRTSFSHGEPVTARVTYLFHCGVPVVNRMMCETYPTLRLGPAAALVEGVVTDLADGSLTLDDAMARLDRIDQARQRHDRDNEAIDELESAGSNDLMYLTWATGARFKVLRAEATMPLQSARYAYSSD